MADKRDISIEVVDSPASKLFVMADKLRLNQVLLNLTSNAIKYNREGGSVTVKTVLQHRDADGNAQIRISISDTGNGIKPEDITKLFQPFERIGAGKTKTEGTGLGLVVVKELIKTMNGAQAVSLAIEYAPDLILLDLDLPDIQGFEVIKLLQAVEKTREIPVVVVSADAMPPQLKK